MSDALSSLLQKLIDTLNLLKGPIFVFLTVVGFLYVNHINVFQVSTFLSQNANYPPILFCVWLAAGVLLIFDGVRWMGGKVTSYTKQRQKTKNAQETLHGLTLAEKQILRQLLQSDEQYHYFIQSELMASLERKNIVKSTGIPKPEYDGHIVAPWAPYLYNLEPWVRNYIHKRPELL